jgi:hypothetical protein
LKGIFKNAWEDICNDFTQCRQEFASKFEHLSNKVNTDIVDIKGRINAIDQIIERNKVTIFLFSTFNSIKESFNGKVLSWSPSISLEGVLFMITSWESSIFILNFQMKDIVDIKGRINAIDQIIERNKVTIKEASDALKRSKEEERVVSDELSHTQEIDPVINFC